MLHAKHDRAMDIYIHAAPTATLSVINYGWEETLPAFQEISNLWDYTILHFVVAGQGFLTIENKRYLLEADTIFAIFPNQSVSYGNLSAENTLVFSWIGFANEELSNVLHGLGFSAETPIISCENSKAIYEKIHLLSKKSAETGDDYALRANALLFDILAELSEQHIQENLPYERILKLDEQIYHIADYINHHFSLPININQLAITYHISRSNLWRAFQKYIGTSPTEYLFHRRLENAKRCLQSGMRVKDAGASSGWPDPYYFSKLFKEKIGLSPREYARRYSHSSKKNE